MSIRGTEVGSGLIMLAENEAFAMAREWEAMANVVDDPNGRSVKWVQGRIFE